MLKKCTIVALLFLTIVACKNNKTPQSAHNNPLMQASDLPLEAPPFDKIKADDFQQAFDSGMKKQLEEIDKIVRDTANPTFENTLVAMEKSGQLLSRVQHAFGILTSANTNPELQKIEEKVSPELAAHFDAIYLNTDLFERVKTIYENRKNLGLDAESLRLTAYYYHHFIRAGAALSDDEKEELKKLNKKAAELSTRFSNRLLAATKAGALTVEDTALLAGLSEGELKTAAQNAENRNLSDKWLLTLQNTTQQPFFQDLDNREVRIKLFQHSWTRAEKG